MRTNLIPTSLMLLSLTLASAAADAPWYRLKEGEQVQGDYTLEPGATQKVMFPATQPTFVGFRTDFPLKLHGQYIREKKPASVELRRDGGNFVASHLGASMEFEPSNGGLFFDLTNKSDLTLKVMVYSRKVAGDPGAAAAVNPSAPGASASTPVRNLVFNGDFSKTRNFLQPEGWESIGNLGLTSGSESFVTLESPTEWNAITQVVPLPSGLRTVKGSFRIQVKQTQSGADNTNFHARFLNGSGREIKAVTLVSGPRQAGSWTLREGLPVAVPSGAVSVKIIISNRGMVDVDDVSLVAN